MIMNKVFTHVQMDIKDDLASETTEAGRFYIAPSGIRLPSVTTVTGRKKSHFFAEWRKKNPKESKRVTRRGSRFHSLIEDYINNDFNPEVETKNQQPDMIDLFVVLKDELDKIDNIRAQEAPLWSELIGLAGRVDCVADYDGVPCIIDFKASSRRKREEDIENYMMQATAYALMWQRRTGQKINDFAILIACEDGTSQVFKGKVLKWVPKLYNEIKDYYSSME